MPPRRRERRQQVSRELEWEDVMKRIVVFVLVLILALLLWWLWRREESRATFAGTLRDAAGAPVPGAKVSVGDQSTVTDEKGRFTIKGSWVGRDRWVLEARGPGFATISKVFHQGSKDTNLTTVRTTSQTFPANSAIALRDNRTSCVGSAGSGVNWAPHPLARFPQVFDANGNRVTGPLPSTAQSALAFLSAAPPCSSGFQVSIAANGLTRASGQPAQGQVQVEVSTVDLYSPDGMPGDYTVASEAGPAYMESFGAGTIEVRSGDEALQLQKGTEAQIVIPVDRGQIEARAQIPPTIPLLRYESEAGVWRQIGEAKLDPKEMHYIGHVGHFSEFNADLVKTNPACLRFDASGIAGDFDLVVTAPTSTGGFKQVTRHVQPNPAQGNPNLHALFNLPPNQWVVLRAVRGGTPVGTWIVATGAPWGGTAAPTYDYAACGATFSLSEAVGAGMTHTGTGHRFGPLPKHVSFLVNTSGASEDVYPVGGTGCDANCLYLFSLFDTGSNLVVIDQAMTTLHGLSLTPNALWDVDVRINGLGAVNASLGAPSSQPGTTGGAQAHTGVLRVAPRNVTISEEETRTDASGNPVGGYVGVNYMLAGTPVTNQVLARIDYTSTVTKGPWTFGAAPFTITAPDIQFYQPGDPGIPSPTLTLFLDGFGSAAPNTTGTTGQRHFLQNVTFTKGTLNVYDEQTPTSPVRFQFDTGTTFTVMSQAMATLLGALPTAPDMAAGCSSNNPANFVKIDSITIVGMNASNQLATYQVNDCEVCVDVAGTVIKTNYADPANPTGPPRIVDAIIGSNLFDQSKVLWNGPKRTLGILP
jgi:hypothetical protein